MFNNEGFEDPNDVGSMSMEDDSDDAKRELTAQCLKPAYQTAGPLITDNRGVHCSSYPNEFCFFCQFERNTRSAGTEADLYGSLFDMVEHLEALRHEPATIAGHVYDAYNETVRRHIDGNPEWTKESIFRHIMYSGQFELVTETSVGQMLTALIARQNATLVDVNTELVVEEHRKAFIHTVECLIKWKNSKKQTVVKGKNSQTMKQQRK